MCMLLLWFEGLQTTTYQAMRVITKNDNARYRILLANKRQERFFTSGKVWSLENTNQQEVCKKSGID